MILQDWKANHVNSTTVFVKNKQELLEVNLDDTDYLMGEWIKFKHLWNQLNLKIVYNTIDWTVHILVSTMQQVWRIFAAIHNIFGIWGQLAVFIQTQSVN